MACHRTQFKTNSNFKEFSIKVERLPHQLQHLSAITLSGYLTDKQNTVCFFPEYQRSDIKGHQVAPLLYHLVEDGG